MLASSFDIMKGGENGKIFTANNSAESKLYYYLNLPLDDKMHMPPDGNSQPNDNEKNLIKLWIDSGASFEGHMKISDNSFSKEILNYLPPLNAYVDPPTKKNLVNLLENDFRIEKVSAESNFIDVKYLGSSFNSKKLNLLLKISENIQRLDLSNIDLTSVNIARLKEFKNIKFLNLSKTNLSGKNLEILPENL